MRLINTKDLNFQEFFDDDIPPYLILSHRWSDDEVSYKDFVKGRKPRSKGYKKIVAFCREVNRQGYEWAWVDTCCIDKSSSAELSEAINSMFRWYKNAGFCIVYLADVTVESTKSVAEERTLLSSEWFDRGWTLQELLAPSHVEFYNSNWRLIGDRYALAECLSAKTRIHALSLRGTRSLSGVSVSEKMSWAARRKTSRVEDMAYCLLGLFDINMPLLYGEGSKAFTRLQEEIIRVSDDDSIFALSFETAEDAVEPPEHASALTTSQQWMMSVLPSSPDQYLGAIGRQGSLLLVQRGPPTVTSIGIQMEIEYIECGKTIWFVPFRFVDAGVRQPHFMVLTSTHHAYQPSMKVRQCVPQWWIQKQLGPKVLNRHVEGKLTLKRASVFVLHGRAYQSYAEDIRRVILA